MNKFAELVTYYQKKGLAETLVRIRSRYFKFLTFIHYKRDLGEEFYGDMPDDEIEIIENDFDLLQKERESRNDLPREFYIDKTHHGKCFCLLYYQGHLAGICWIFKKGEYSRFFTVKNPTSCELNYIITLPAFRGNRLATRFTNYICEHLKHQNIKVVYLSASEGNVLSRRVISNAGFKEYMTVRSYFSYVRKIKV